MARITRMKCHCIRVIRAIRGCLVLVRLTIGFIAYRSLRSWHPFFLFLCVIESFFCELMPQINSPKKSHAKAQRRKGKPWTGKNEFDFQENLMQKIVTSLCLAALLLTAAGELRAENWPGWRGPR